MLLPFEMAVREGGARSVMNSYTEIDGVPVAADAALLTGCCATSGASRAPSSPTTSVDRVPADTARRRRRRRARPAALALAAGIDVELPHGRAATASRWPRRVRAGARRPRSWSTGRAAGAAPEGRARPARPGLDAEPCADAGRCDIDLDPSTGRSPRELAERRSCCWPTTATLPLAAAGSVALVGPLRRRPARRCSAATPSPTTSWPQHPDMRLGHRGADAARRAARRRSSALVYAPGCARRLDDDPTRRRRGGRRGRRAPTCACGRRRPRGAVRPRHVAARAATPRTSRCPASRTSSRGAARRPARRSCSSCCSGPAVRARRATPTGAAAIVQAFLPGEEGGGGDRRRADRATVEPARQAARAGARGRRARSRPPTCTRCSAAPASGVVEHRPDAAVRRSATGCRTRRSTTTRSR